MDSTEYPEGWEEWFAFLTANLPEPIQQQETPSGITIFTAGDPPEVVVRFSPSFITVSGFAHEWDQVPQRLGTIMWRRVPSGKAISIVAALLASARALRQGMYPPA